MGYNSEGAQLGWVCFDIETAARDDVGSLIPPPEADKRLTDPAKIAADLERKIAASRDRLPLDANGCTIVTISYQREDWTEPEVLSVPADERFMIERFLADSKGRTLIGYCSRTFDLPVILQRARFLGLPVPPWRDLLAPYGRARRHVDLFDELTFDNGRQDGVIPRRLSTFCHLFGLDVPSDETTGADVAALLKAGDLAAVRAHCLADVAKTVALATALGVIRRTQIAAASSF